jgi:flavodoxin, short chain
MKALVAFWSQTGNTEAMANAIAEGLKDRYSVDVVNVNDELPEVSDYDLVALGCPAMGSEVLEEDVFEPFYQSIRNELFGTKVILFGSYGWGDGEWMRNWVEDAKEAGAILYKNEGFAIQEDEDDIVNRCIEYAKGVQ